jgi:hypothetical protein
LKINGDTIIYNFEEMMILDINYSVNLFSHSIHFLKGNIYCRDLGAEKPTKHLVKKNAKVSILFKV